MAPAIRESKVFHSRPQPVPEADSVPVKKKIPSLMAEDNLL
jgi:hypothetical protein